VLGAEAVASDGRPANHPEIAVYLCRSVSTVGAFNGFDFTVANSQMMTLFLAHVAAELADYFIVMLVDRAGWHMSHQLTVPENLRLLPQPPGSPELNPAEHLWDELRENETANRSFDSLEHLETALCQGLNRLASNPARLRSMTNFPYMQISL
jgi:hypothetical protein